MMALASSKPKLPWKSATDIRTHVAMKARLADRQVNNIMVLLRLRTGALHITDVAFAAAVERVSTSDSLLREMAGWLLHT